MEVDRRISNNCRNFASAKLGEKMDEDEGENKRIDGGGVDRLYNWPSSRIVRVSRATGGKDRHSKVLTSKGLRDRRVRLSVNTAIQFYDLQDRLGYDQPSKAVEWLLTAAASAIEELPPIDTDFLNAPRVCNEGFYGNLQLTTKSSPGSSNSETSKGSSGISVSRSESRMKDKKESDSSNCYVSSFTELLSGRNGGPDYFTNGLFGPPAAQPAQMFSVTAGHHHPPELQPFSFVNRGTLQSNSPSPQFPPPPSFFSGAAADNHHHFVNGFHYGRNSYQKEKENN